MLSFFTNLLTVPAIVLGLVAMVGLIVQKKSGPKVFTGALKCALGMIILTAGTGIIVTYLSPFSDLFTKVFHITGVVPYDEVVVGALAGKIAIVGSTSALIMAIGFLVNILLARITPLKYIFLTGHMMWISSIVIAFLLYENKFSELMIVIIGSALQGILLTLLPAIMQPTVRKLTGSNDIALGHLTTLGIFLSTRVGMLGGKKNDTEDMKMPESLSFFKDIAVSVSIVMFIFYLIIVIMAGPAAVAKYDAGQNYILFGLIEALGVAAGILIMLQGVRMLLGELIPSFKGISDKLVPGAIPALDVPVFFGYAPNALMLGFIFSVPGMVLGMFISGYLFGVLPIVSIIGAFFTGGTSGIMGNAVGGRRGAMVSGFLYGLILVLLAGGTFHVFNFAKYVTGVSFACSDVMVAFPLFIIPWVGIGLIVASFVLLSVLEVRYKKRIQKEKAGKEIADKEVVHV